MNQQCVQWAYSRWHGQDCQQTSGGESGPHVAVLEPITKFMCNHVQRVHRQRAELSSLALYPGFAQACKTTGTHIVLHVSAIAAYICLQLSC
jgi:hypothetical protein